MHTGKNFAVSPRLRSVQALGQIELVSVRISIPPFAGRQALPATRPILPTEGGCKNEAPFRSLGEEGPVPLR